MVRKRLRKIIVNVREEVAKTMELMVHIVTVSAIRCDMIMTACFGVLFP